MSFLLSPWFLVPASAIALVGLLIAWWKIPTYFVDRKNIINYKEQSEVEDAHRKTIAQFVGGIAFMATFAFTVFQFFSQAELTSRQDANKQYIEAAKLLTEKDSGTQSAGLHALANVAENRSEYLVPVTNTVVAFIRSKPDPAPVKNKLPSSPINADVQAAIFVLSKLERSPNSPIDLSGAYLARGNFSLGRKIAFRDSNFQGASMYAADLRGLDLTNALFDGTKMADWEAYGPTFSDDKTPESKEYKDDRHLLTVNFERANLTNAGFDNTWMGGANLRYACLVAARFNNADLSRADLTGAKLAKSTDCGVELSGTDKAHFHKTPLKDSIFKDVDISGVTFSDLEISGANFSEARNVKDATFANVCTSQKRPAIFPDGPKFFRDCPQ